MPVMLSYNLDGATPPQHNHIQSMFERLGWQNVGGSCYRFPALSVPMDQPEDWFNSVVPALMLFRAYVLHNGLNVSKFSLDAQSSTGHDAGAGVGSAIAAAATANFAPNALPTFGAQNLEDWINGASASVPY